MTYDTKLNTLMQYIGRGWALVPLHDVSAGACSCGRDCGDSAGKHPRWGGWQQPGQLIRSADLLAQLHTASPQWNWGVATGAASGVFVLDWDIKHDLGIRAWLEEHIEGDWQPHETPYLAPDLGTLTLGPTGGGGWHYVFALPDFEVRNSQNRGRYGLPVGLDVRGNGGQIVVAPSVSAKGPYGGVLLDRPMMQAPAWLLDMLRPQPDAQPVDRASVDNAMLSTPGAIDRLAHYAGAAVRGSLEELASAVEGTRNDTAARTARRVLELVQSPWSGLDGARTVAAWFDAGAATGLPYSELEGVWRRAERDMAGKSVAPPELSGWGGEYVPFDLTAAPIGIMPPDPFSDPGMAGAAVRLDETAHETAQVSAYETEVAREVWRLKIKEEARRRLEAERLATFAERLAKMEAALLSSADLDGLPELVPLVDGLLWLDSFARVIGESGHGKSFVMLDIAGCVGAGIPWAGHPTTQADVIYLVAEGQTGIKQRVRAWEKINGRAMSGVTFLPMPVQADSPEWDVFIELARRRVAGRPSLIVGDTQARLSVGVDENSATEMGLLVDAMERLRSATGACVCLVHHKGLKGGAGRGSSAVRGALHTEIDVSMDKAARLISVSTPKQKDTADDDAPTVFRLTEVELSEPFADRRVSSAVPVWQPGEGTAGRTEPADRIIDDDRLPAVAARIAAVFAKLAITPVTEAELRGLVTTKGTETYVCSKASYFRAMPTLRKNKVVAKVLGSQRWRYVPVDERSQIREEITATKSSDGYYTT